MDDAAFISFMEAAVAKYIGDKNTAGVSGLGQTISELLITR